MKIRILVTGGTFDKEYDELSGKLFFKDTHVQEMLRLGRARPDLAIETAMVIDRLDIDDAGRGAIVVPCPKPPSAGACAPPRPDTSARTPTARPARRLLSD